MQSSSGRVLFVNDNVARVAVAAEPVCARCAAGKGCGAGLFGNQSGTQELDVRLTPGLIVEPGDVVEVAMRPVKLLQAAVLVYGLPLSGALLGGAVAMATRLADTAAVLAVLAGLVAGLLAARFKLRQQACLRSFEPVVTGTR